MKRLIFLCFPILFSCNPGKEVPKGPPRMVIALVIDQMRFDLLDRFDTIFGEGGFKRLKREGFEFRNCYFNYAQTLTSPGHASISTGSPPSVHGIVANDWYDLETHQPIYAVLDTEVVVYGNSGIDSANGRSPKNLQVSTIGDQFKSAFGENSKVIGVSLKDRASILLSGKGADMALWMKNDGYWATSSFYGEKLPGWVQEWNSKGALRKYEDSIWTPIFDIYPGTSDLQEPFERVFKGQKDAGFPKVFSEIVAQNGPRVLQVSPFGNTELLDFTIEAIGQYELGLDDIPDLLAMSFSSTDKIGHAFGPYSEEIADTYLRLDGEIERLLGFLDSEFGKGGYTLFVTGDHGICNIPGRIDSVNNGGGHVYIDEYVDTLNSVFEEKYDIADLISFYKDEQIWLNEDLMEQNGLDKAELISIASEYLEAKDGIKKIVQNDGSNAESKLDQLVLNGVFPARSGQLYVLYEPGFVEHWGSGVDHGTPYEYDRHVPLIWFGNGIESGISLNEVASTQIAPSLCKLMGIEIPTGSKAVFLEGLDYSE